MMSETLEIVSGFTALEGAQCLKACYADLPLSRLPGFIFPLLLRNWEKREDVFYLIARSQGEIAGFIFAQSVGPKPWRRLLGYTFAFPFALFAWLLVRLSRFRDSFISPPQQGFSPLAEPLSFASAANVEFVFVDPRHRGKGVAGQLLFALEQEVSTKGIGTILAFIGPRNTASIHAFRKAGWAIYRDGRTLRAIRKLA